MTVSLPFAALGKRLGRRLRRLVDRSSPQGASASAVPYGSDATIPAPPQYGWAEDLHGQQMAALATAGDPDILLVGDSLAQHWPLDLWSPWSAFSLGVGGDRTQHILWRLDALRSAPCRPRRILVVAGTNNLLTGGAAADVAAGITAIASRLEALYPAAALYVLLPPPFGVGLQDGTARCRALKRLMAPRFGSRLIEAEAAMTAGGREPNSNYQNDRVHFSPQGYEVLTGVVRMAFG